MAFPDSQIEEQPDPILDRLHDLQIVHPPDSISEPALRRSTELLAHDERTPVEVRLIRSHLNVGGNVRAVGGRKRNRNQEPGRALIEPRVRKDERRPISSLSPSLGGRKIHPP